MEDSRMVENQGYQVGGVNDLAEWFPADETQWGKKTSAPYPHVDSCTCSTCNYAIDNGFSVSVLNTLPEDSDGEGNRRQAFIEKVENRTNNAVRYIRSIANLSSVKNQQRYEWTEQDIKDTFKFIESEVRLAKKKMMLNDSLPRPFKLG